MLTHFDPFTAVLATAHLPSFLLCAVFTHSLEHQRTGDSLRREEREWELAQHRKGFWHEPVNAHRCVVLNLQGQLKQWAAGDTGLHRWAGMGARQRRPGGHLRQKSPISDRKVYSRAGAEAISTGPRPPPEATHPTQGPSISSPGLMVASPGPASRHECCEDSPEVQWLIMLGNGRDTGSISVRRFHVPQGSKVRTTNH